MKARDIIVHYRVIGPILTMVLVSFILGFIVGLAGYSGTGLTSLASATGLTFGGIWIVIGAGYELYAAIERYRAD